VRLLRFAAPVPLPRCRQSAPRRAVRASSAGPQLSAPRCRARRNSDAASRAMPPRTGHGRRAGVGGGGERAHSATPNRPRPAPVVGTLVSMLLKRAWAVARAQRADAPRPHRDGLTRSDRRDQGSCARRCHPSLRPSLRADSPPGREVGGGGTHPRCSSISGARSAFHTVCVNVLREDPEATNQCSEALSPLTGSLGHAALGSRTRRLAVPCPEVATVGAAGTWSCERIWLSAGRALAIMPGCRLSRCRWRPSGPEGQ
jgi:hypothetical protein